MFAPLNSRGKRRHMLHHKAHSSHISFPSFKHRHVTATQHTMSCHSMRCKDFVMALLVARSQEGRFFFVLLGCFQIPVVHIKFFVLFNYMKNGQNFTHITLQSCHSPLTSAAKCLCPEMFAQVLQLKKQRVFFSK